jgi:hypothetical protein
MRGSPPNLSHGVPRLALQKPIRRGTRLRPKVDSDRYPDAVAPAGSLPRNEEIPAVTQGRYQPNNRTG